ncbi:MAG: glycosyltransferase family 2 protein [Spirochaetes bacterium]|nr:glycosyltransferase family 2 protein [Spirochaetota bacterium]
MLFNFLKYINPTWYFNLIAKKQNIPYFVDYRKLDKEEQALLEIDDGYCTEVGCLADAAYQAWHKGIMKKDPAYSLYTSAKFQKAGKERVIELFDGHQVTVKDDVFVTNINDNYRFIRRFFNPLIAWYILFIRLFSFHNPAKELSGFLRSLKVKRVDLYKKNSWLLLKNDYDVFDSALIRQQPKVSVIIPTLNRYNYLKDVLSDLEKQDYKNFEVIVCDQSDSFNAEFYKAWHLHLKVIRQDEKALCKARNVSMNEALGEYILLFDDDSRVQKDWILQHLKCLDYFNADISCGVSLSVVGDIIPQNYSFFRWSDQLDTGNVMFRKGLLKTSGLLDRQFEGQTNEDAEFGLRLYLLGFKAISNHLAKRIHLKASTGGMREMSGWDQLRPNKFFKPRPIPSLLYLSRKYFGNHISLLMLLFSVPSSIVPYRFKKKKWLKILSIIFVFVIWPFIIVQVIMSWQSASAKMKKGPKISILN